MRRALLAATVVAVALVAPLAGAGAAKETDSYFGTVPGTEDIIGFLVLELDDGPAVGSFLCNTAGIDRFEFEDVENHKLNATSGSGARVKAIVSKEQIRGTVRYANDTTVRFVASRTEDHVAGLRRCPTLSGLPSTLPDL